MGGDIGILGAPASPPDADRLIEDGWTVCTGTDPGLRLDVAERAGGAQRGGGRLGGARGRTPTT